MSHDGETCIHISYQTNTANNISQRTHVQDTVSPSALVVPMTSTVDVSPHLSNTTISSLPYDLLIHIFYLNTYTPETEYGVAHTVITSPSSDLYPPIPTPSPLTTARHTSQVCCTWRHAILTSPTIWARAIDMTALEAAASPELWIAEVLLRSGEDELAITGCVGMRARGLKPVFLNRVLEDNWLRVRRVDIWIEGGMKAWREYPHWKVVFGQPAPRLESLVVHASWGYSVRERLGDGLRIVAPLLRRFHCPMVVFDIAREAWVGRLWSLTLSQPFGVSEVLRILRKTGHIQSLVISDPHSPSLPAHTDEVGRDEKVFLPSLVRLDLSGTVSQCLFLLQILIVHPNCTLILRVKDYGGEYDEQKNNQLLDIAAPYIARYLAIHRPRRVMVNVGTAEHRFHAIQHTDLMHFGHPETGVFYRPFSDRAYAKVVLFREGIVQMLSKAVAALVTEDGPVVSTSVVEMEVVSHKFRSVSVQPSLGLRVLLQSLSVSLDTIILTPNSFRHLSILNDVDGTHSSNPFSHSAFPSPLPAKPLLLHQLKAIQLNAKEAMDMTPSHFLAFQNDVLTFFDSHRRAGAWKTPRQRWMMPQLEMVGIVSARELRHDWSFLDLVHGLKVVWKDGRGLEEENVYVCGSGDRKRLDWRLARGG